jgi:cytochrome P450
MVCYDPFDYALHDDPYPIYRELRDQVPVYHNEERNFWALSRYADCQAAVRDFKTFSSAKGTSLEDLKAQVKLLINTDPPEHTKMRHLISKLFTPAQVAPLEAAVRKMAKELLAPHLGSGRISSRILQRNCRWRSSASYSVFQDRTRTCCGA